MNLTEFYPTPDTLIKDILSNVDWRYVHSVLEPNAGNGNIVDGILKDIKEKEYSQDLYHKTLDIDCVEIDPELQHILQGKELRVVHDDFLTFNTFKRYDMIVMNPPFSNGVKHLLKAIHMQENGGGIICILNAETIKNPYTNERKELVALLKQYDATIEYKQTAFVSAERTTNVEVAVIKMLIPEKEKTSFIYEELKKRKFEEQQIVNPTAVAEKDYIKAIVANYDVELAAGVKLIQEYEAMAPYILESIGNKSYNHPILELKVNGKDRDDKITAFVESVRLKYWNAIFKDPRFTSKMTSQQRSDYLSQVDTLKDYDFSFYNIKTVQEQMCKELVSGIEKCILELFESFTMKHCWYPECESNIHYYDGWSTNKSFYINKKVIIPLRTYDNIWKEMRYDYTVLETLRDIEKVFDYLGSPKDGERRDMHNNLQWAEKNGVTKRIELTHFYVTFYKKGTCHIEFKDEELLKKFNIFAGKYYNWLPPSYGKKTYSEMTQEEKTVVNEFEGEKEYAKVLNNPEFYIYKASNILLEANLNVEQEANMEVVA